MIQINVVWTTGRMMHHSGNAMMTVRTWARIGHRITATLRRWRHPTLAGPLAGISDRDINAALERAGLNRADLFTPAGAIASHRVYLAYMLAARHVDMAKAAGIHWEALKLADDICAHCPNTGRCRRWLESQGPSAVSIAFCPNAGLFDTIAGHRPAGPV